MLWPDIYVTTTLLTSRSLSALRAQVYREIVRSRLWLGGLTSLKQLCDLGRVLCVEYAYHTVTEYLAGSSVLEISPSLSMMVRT